MKGETMVAKAKDVGVKMLSEFQKDTVQTFLSLVHENIAEHWKQNMDENIMTGFGQSGMRVEALYQNWEISIENGASFTSSERIVNNCNWRLERLSWSCKCIEEFISPGSGGREDRNCLWVSRRSLLYLVYGAGERGDEDFALIQYMKCTWPSDKIGDTLGFVSVMDYRGRSRLYKRAHRVWWEMATAESWEMVWSGAVDYHLRKSACHRS